MFFQHFIIYFTTCRVRVYMYPGNWYARRMVAIYEIFDFSIFLSPSKVSMSLSVSQYKYTNARLSMWHLTGSSATRYIFRGFEPLILKGIQQCFRPASQFPRQFKHTAMVVGPFVQEFTHPHCRSCRNRHRCSTFLPRFRKQRV